MKESGRRWQVALIAICSCLTVAVLLVLVLDALFWKRGVPELVRTAVSRVGSLLGIQQPDDVSYRVGPGQPYARVSQVASKLIPGDVVEVIGGTSDAFVLTNHGTADKPITIRGAVQIVRGQAIRPRIRIPADGKHAIICRGDWNVLQGLEITGATSNDWDRGTAVRQECDNLTIRNCLFSKDMQGIYAASEAGSTLVEFCEFDSNGGLSSRQSTMHSVHASSMSAAALLTVRYCYFHDARGGAFVKSRTRRNSISCNWFENHDVAALYIVDSAQPKDVKSPALYPMDSDIAGNVFLSSISPDVTRWKVLQLGAESEDAAGTEGDFNIAHNLFIIANAEDDPSAPILVHGNVNRVLIVNNVFFPIGASRFRPYERGSVWPGPRTDGFMKRRGSADPVVEASNNWVSESAVEVPPSFRGTIRGLNPVFRDLNLYDYSPGFDSPLCGGGAWPLPRGCAVDMWPDAEPQRGIPTALKPRPRRKAFPPSIGPFEAAP